MDSSCRAAAMAMVYEYSGINNQTEMIIWERLKVPRQATPGYYLQTRTMAKDSLVHNLSYFYGQAVLSSPELALQSIKEFLIHSIPVIVCQKISILNPLGHFRVVVATDDHVVTFHDPMNDIGPTSLSINEFISLWSNAGNDEVVGGEFFAIFKKGQMPPDSKFTVYTFESLISYFTATTLNFI